MRIRFLNQVDSVAPFLRDLVIHLAEHGHEVEVMISDVEYREGRKDLREVFKHPNVNLHYIHVGRAAERRVLQRLYGYSRFVLGAMWATLFGKSVDLNFFLTQPPMFPLWGFVLKLLRRQQYAVLIMDLYPDVAIRSGIIGENSLPARFMGWVSRVALRHSKAVFVIGRCMRDRLLQWGIPEQKLHIATLWANENVIYPIEPNENILRRELGLEDKFVVLYSGNIGVGHFFDDILEVARRLKDRSDLCFVFIGTGSRRKEIEAAKTQYQLENVLLLPFQPEEKLAHSLSMGDIHFISLREGFEGLMVPSKAYGVFTAGRGAIYQGNLKGEIALEIQEYDMGSVLTPSDPDRLEHILLDYMEHPEKARSQGKNALAAASTSFGRSESINRYRLAIEALI
jgi:colanic acid biosynthesis glycosyl transferase WcaI